MDVGTLVIGVAIVVAGLVLALARRAPSDEGDASAFAQAILGPLFDPAPERFPVVRPDDEAVRWRVELLRPRGSAPADVRSGQEQPRPEPARPRIGDAARLGR